MTISIKDETISGALLQELFLEFKTETTTVQEIITQRVLHEVAQYNERSTDYFHGLIVPSDAEKTLNGYKMKETKQIDGEKQVYIALDAFNKNGFFLLIDNQQSEHLTQKVELKSTTTISFLKLTPLVGG
jgi:selenophosphate synthase